MNHHTLHVSPSIFDAIADAALGAVLARDLLPTVEDSLVIVEADGGQTTGREAHTVVTHVLGPVDLIHLVGVDDLALINFEVTDLRNRPRNRTVLHFGADPADHRVPMRL